MIAHTPRQQKIKTANGVQGNNLIRTFSMEFDGAAAAMHIDVSADVWQIDFTARLAGMDEAPPAAGVCHYGEAAFLGMVFRSAIRTVPLLLPPAWVMWRSARQSARTLQPAGCGRGYPLD
ncbi:phage tail protein [Escherichia coli]|uniref:phage tail-collar fiber domain-containing protein n=1 Tax=Escherichia coli TaxID=562 RepID=UPI003B27DCBF